MGAYHNENIKVFTSEARTETTNSSDFENMQGKGIKLVINVTAVTSTPSVTFAIEGKDSTSSEYYTILESAAITTTGTTVLTVYPGLTASANAVANDVLPRVWRVSATHADADAITYSVGACVMR